MLYFARWKVWSIILICLAGVMFSLPNLFTREQLNRMPSWLPTHQVNLGLDLRGGAHLLLEVDTASVVRERLESLVDGARAELRSANLRYTGISITGSNAVSVRLREPADGPRVREALQKLAQPMQSSMLGIGGGQPDVIIEQGEGVVRLVLSEQAVLERTRSAVAQSMEIVRRRIDQTGVNEPTIQIQGRDRILVQLPGVDEPERIKRLLGTTAKLTFHLLDNTADPNSVTAPIGSMILDSDKDVDPSTGRPMRFVVKRKVEVSGDMLSDAQAGTDARSGQPVVNFRFNTAGAKRFAEITQANVGLPFAVVLDNMVLTAPRINEPILGGSGQISGNFTFASANELAVLLRAGALPAPLKVVEERTVGPDLGADSIRAGLLSILIAAILVLLYMVLAYGLFGLFANIALIANLLLTLAAMSLLQATLTLPGIAGLLLTLGMSVDANVLINERIREETKLGKSPMAAMETGFKRAFSTIVDANVTTLLKMLILYALGSGSVKGFAVTISLGIITSMFTATVVVRLMMVSWLRSRKVTALPV
ncbi:protein translocase subunit SecD [Ferrovibrio sp.]|uniref:protein translocase subunit SecD n=1 Tax=Ferrovibrio sp. TaxID=1917215 RepID=UPI0035B165C1